MTLALYTNEQPVDSTVIFHILPLIYQFVGLPRLQIPFSAYFCPPITPQQKKVQLLHAYLNMEEVGSEYTFHVMNTSVSLLIID